MTRGQKRCDLCAYRIIKLRKEKKSSAGKDLYPREVDVPAMVAEKDTRLVQRMGQLAAAISMSRMEISGHKRAKERAAVCQIAAESQALLKISDATVLFRRAALAAKEEEEEEGGGGGEGGGAAEEEDSAAGVGEGVAKSVADKIVADFARRYALDEETVRGLLRYYQHAESEEVTDTAGSVKGPAALKLIKRWRGGNF